MESWDHPRRVAQAAERYKLRKSLSGRAAIRAREETETLLVDQFQNAVLWAREDGMSISDIARVAGVARTTIYQALEQTGFQK